MKHFKQILISALLLSVLATTAYAEKIGTIATSGWLIKDTLEVHAFDDPNIGGISCYVTLPKRSFSIEDQTDTSISCRKVGKVTGDLGSKSRIFKNKKSWFMKSLYIDRIYDHKRNVLVYVSYTAKLSGDNANNSVSVVALNN